MYLTAVIDWFNRKIVGWNLSDMLSTQPVLEAVKDSVARYGIPAILNSDQGSEFTSEEYKKLLRELHIRQSMDGKSRLWRAAGLLQFEASTGSGCSKVKTVLLRSLSFLRSWS